MYSAYQSGPVLVALSPSALLVLAMRSFGTPKRARQVACGAERRHASVDASGQSRRDLLQQPTIAVGITEGGERPVSTVFRIWTSNWTIRTQVENSLTSMPASTRAFRVASMSETIKYVLWAEPGAAEVRPLPNWTEQAEPCGVN